MPYVPKDLVTKFVIPIFEKALTDDIPNVKFCATRIIDNQKSNIDSNVYSSQLVPKIKENCNDADTDVRYFSIQCL
jgi:hypothetical protein